MPIRYRDLDDVDFDSVSADDVRVVGLGGKDLTVTFSADVDFHVRVRWDEDRGYDQEPETLSERIRDYARLSGTAKLRVNATRSGIDEVVFIELDQNEIEVTAQP